LKKKGVRQLLANFNFGDSFMNWLFLALVSGLILGFYDISKKMALSKASVLSVLSLYSLVSFVFLLFEWKNALAVDMTALPLVVLKSLVIYFCWIMEFIAFQHLSISVATPFKTLNPIFSILWGIMLLGEHLGILQGAGFIVIFGAYYIIARSDRKGKESILHFFKNRYLYLIFASSFLSSLSGLIDKFALKRMNTGQMQFWFMLFLSLLFISTFVVTELRKGKRPAFTFNIYILFTAVTIVLSDRLYFSAIAIPESMLSVIMPVRFISVFVSVLVGGFIFKEDNLKVKFIAIANLLVGVTMIFLG
jgi:drug/metabolite transporter (DMT)-like permease